MSVQKYHHAQTQKQTQTPMKTHTPSCRHIHKQSNRRYRPSVKTRWLRHPLATRPMTLVTVANGVNGCQGGSLSIRDKFHRTPLYCYCSHNLHLFSDTSHLFRETLIMHCLMVMTRVCLLGLCVCVCVCV